MGAPRRARCGGDGDRGELRREREAGVWALGGKESREGRWDVSWRGNGGGEGLQRRGAVVERQRAAVVAGTLARREEALPHCSAGPPHAGRRSPATLLRVRPMRGRGRRGGAVPRPWPRAGIASAMAPRRPGAGEGGREAVRQRAMGPDTSRPRDVDVANQRTASGVPPAGQDTCRPTRSRVLPELPLHAV